jgi:hypothetical protein
VTNLRRNMVWMDASRPSDADMSLAGKGVQVATLKLRLDGRP